jgi:N-acyl-D-aspartate/D-glutamate deacylase
MKRRRFIELTTSASILLPAASFGAIKIKPPSFQTILTNGKIFLQGKWQPAHIGIDTTGKLNILSTIPTEGKIIDVAGNIISPGFIDILADNASKPESTYKTFEKFKVTDGVTTALQMHGGSEKCGWYYQHFGGLPHYINFGVSVFVMRIRNATSSLADRKKIVEKNLDEGALAVSHSIEYQPTPYPEVLEYAKLAKKYDRPFFLHLRYSSTEQELEGVDEAIQLAKESGARVHIDHLHSTGGTFHMKEALDKIRLANQQGLPITCCVYPYSYWATYLHSTRFDEGWKQRYKLDYNDLRLVGSGERLTAESFSNYRKMMKLVAVPEGTMPFDKTIDLALKEDFCMIGSDGGIENENLANNHPRGAGNFATAVRHGLDIGMSLEKILGKITTMPRSLVLPVMKNRGVIENGAMADLTVFDQAIINGKASVENPNQFSVGIKLVIVNGKVAYQNILTTGQGKLGEAAGVGLKF